MQAPATATGRAHAAARPAGVAPLALAAEPDYKSPTKMIFGDMILGVDTTFLPLGTPRAHTFSRVRELSNCGIIGASQAYLPLLVGG